MHWPTDVLQFSTRARCLLVLPAFAKINLDLRVLGVRPDGYHDLRTVFQSLALHDVLTFTRRTGPFTIECDDPTLPVDRRNLVWKAASLLWRTVGRRRGETPRDVVVGLRKRIPQAAGLGGGSADAAMTLLALSRLWDLDVDLPTLSRLAARLGADVPFFLVGGTALGLGRGDDIYPLADLPRTHVVIVRPRFGVSTTDAYGWYDAEPRRTDPRARAQGAAGAAGRIGRVTCATISSRRSPGTIPTIARISHALMDAGAVVRRHVGLGIGGFRPVRAARRRPPHRRPTWPGPAGRSLCTRTLVALRVRSAAAARACGDPEASDKLRCFANARKAAQG